jgi:AraC-like DNA-binding protein
MRRMSNTTPITDGRLSRLETDRDELAERIARALTHSGVVEPQPGVFLSRFTTTAELVHGFLDPCFCLIAQGAKALTFGDEVFRYDAAQYMVSTVGLPMTAQVVEASVARPYLGARLTLDPAVVASVMVEAGIVQSRGDGDVKAVAVSTLDADLLDATLRLVRLMERPGEYRVIAPLITREIVYRLLIGAQGSRMRHLATFGGEAHRMVRAVSKLRDNFDKPLRIESIARELGMSLSGFHAHFKTVTNMSPLQFQKQIRLQEARRLMITENLDAAEAGYRVGYDDASHFNREYKRHFGEPPMRNKERLRELATA